MVILLYVNITNRQEIYKIAYGKKKDPLFYIGKITKTHCKDTKINCNFTFFLCVIKQMPISKKYVVRLLKNFQAGLAIFYSKII